jgi:glycosyltransferase involved in cell wall biosynthesis
MTMMNNDLKVLFILGSMDVGGVQSGIMNFAKVMTPMGVHFDVMVHSEKEGFHEAEFLRYGDIYRIPLPEAKNRISTVFLLIYNNFRFRSKLKRFLRKHQDYDVVHCKSLYYCAAATQAAKAAGIPIRVAHSHVDNPKKMHPYFKWYFSWCARRIEKTATAKLGVSEGAVKYLFGRYGGCVVKNPTISLEKLDPSQYAPDAHEGIRLIHIGTFSKRKNQCFSIEILNELKKREPASTLTFIGYSLDDPDYINEMNAAIKKYSLEGSVMFLPKDSDVPKELSETDYMLLPSLREGLPNVALEAQAMGVPCFLSDDITRATDCGLCAFLSLNDSAEAWASVIMNYRIDNGRAKRYVDMSMWDNRTICKEYLKIWRAEKCSIS